MVKRLIAPRHIDGKLMAAHTANFDYAASIFTERHDIVINYGLAGCATRRSD